VNGQHAQTHLLPLERTTLVVLVSLVPVPAWTPGSPEPVSPEVWCQGAEPISKALLAGLATSVTEPGGRHTLAEAVALKEPPAIEIVHQLK
jgi:hypothetical protein